MNYTKIIVLDDDPTGSQTVHGCLLLTRWDVATLREARLDQAPLFFVLTNTRGMEAKRAADITREVCHNLSQALDELKQKEQAINPILVSRSDSTLRSHSPAATGSFNRLNIDMVISTFNSTDALQNSSKNKLWAF